MKITCVDDRARALLDLVAAGNESAYEELYRLLSRRVYAYARRMIRNAESADEIMLDTMYEVWRTAARYRGDARVITWILGIARNKVLMAMRSKPGIRHEDIDDYADLLESEVPDGYSLLAQKQTRELLHRCLQGLSEKHRECIHLTHFEDMSMPEVAAVLGIPEGTVKSRLSHARAQLAARVSARMLAAPLRRAQAPINGSAPAAEPPMAAGWAFPGRDRRDGVRQGLVGPVMRRLPASGRTTQ